MLKSQKMKKENVALPMRIFFNFLLLCCLSFSLFSEGLNVTTSLCLCHLLTDLHTASDFCSLPPSSIAKISPKCL